MTCPVKAIFLLQKDYYIGFVGLMHIQFCQPTGQEACLLGTIHLSFFLLPLAQGESLGVPVYKDRGLIKKRRSLQIGNWKDDKWPWEAKESNPQRPFNSSGEFKKTRVRIWHLKTSIIGKNCLALWVQYSMFW